ncbi:MAG: hypothetical protein ACTHXC_00315 [Brachybacterium sp.]
MGAERFQKNYHAILGETADGEIYGLDYVFRYEGSFHGATGSVMRAVFQSEIDEARTDDAKSEYYDEIWRSVVAERGTEMSLEDWADQIDDDEYIDGRFEEPSGYRREDILEAIGVTDNGFAPVRFELIGVGRVFHDDTLASIVTPSPRFDELAAIIRRYENVRWHDID